MHKMYMLQYVVQDAHLDMYVAPSLFQRVISKCIGMTSDIAVYKKNRDLLYDGLTN